jgi:hypothetical protein
MSRPLLIGSFLLRFAPHDPAPPMFGIAPDHDLLGAGGGTGRIVLTAPQALSWSVQGAPDWIRIRDAKGSGGGMIKYEVMENRSNSRRSATITVGNASFEISQARPAYTYLPFLEEFRQLPLPVWELRDPNPISISDPPARWFLDNNSDHNATLRLAAGGPEGSSSLIIEKPKYDEQEWKTQVWLPRLKVEPAVAYEVSLWLKAEHATHVRLTLGQRVPPYHICGFSTPVAVGTDWKKSTMSFRVEEDGCDAEQNRLAVEAGAVAGKLSIAGLSLREQSLQRRSGK